MTTPSGIENPRTSGLAIASLILSLLGIIIGCLVWSFALLPGWATIYGDTPPQVGPGFLIGIFSVLFLGPLAIILGLVSLPISKHRATARRNPVAVAAIVLAVTYATCMFLSLCLWPMGYL